MPGRLADGRHEYTAEIARVHALHVADEPVAFAWDRGAAIGFPKFRVRQLATWIDLVDISPSAGLRPGTYIVEAFPIGWFGPRKPRPIAIYPGDDLANWRTLRWFDAHTGQTLGTLTTDLDRLDVDVVIVESLVDAAIAWGRPRYPRIPDVIVIDPALVRRTGRRGIAMIERANTPVVADVDPAAMLADAYETLGATKFADVTGGRLHDGKHLGEGRQPRPAKIARLAGGTDPRSIARFVDAVRAASPRCSFDGCAEPIRPRCKYCPAHAALVRRENNRKRMRRARARARARRNRGTR
jgi:hypothetical protein